MMLESFVLYVARDRVEKYGKDYLLKPEGILEIFAEACKQLYIVQGKEIKQPDEYIQWILNDPIIHDVGVEILFLYHNLGVRQYDTHHSLKKKKQVINNSIIAFERLFQNLKDNFDYQTFEDDNEKNSANYILENLKTKIKDNEELERILDSMNNIKMNFIINYKGQDIYPLITDLLTDVVFSEFTWYLDKDLIQAIITKWNNAKAAQNERGFFDFAQYTKMELVEKIKYKNLRRFLLAEYARTLNVDKYKLRQLMQHILYYDVGNHKNTPSLEFNIIDKIPKRPFLLERTKFVIGGL